MIIMMIMMIIMIMIIIIIVEIVSDVDPAEWRERGKSQNHVEKNLKVNDMH